MDGLFSNVFILIVINFIFVVGYVFFLLFGLDSRRPSDLIGRESKLIPNSLQNYWYAITKPLVKLFIKAKIAPNLITMTGFIISVIAAFFLSAEKWGAAGWIIILAVVLDILDGRVARSTNKVTQSGRYFDSITDRFSEGALTIGFVYAFKDHWMLFAVLVCFISSYLVSFTRAKAEADGVKSCEIGVFQRSERFFMLCIGLVFSPIISYYADSSEQWFLYAVIIVLGAGNIYTTVHRVVYSFKELEKLGVK